MSEIVFYDTSGKELEGKHIGPSGSYEDLGDTGDKAFDGSIFTFYDAADASSWTGLDFGEDKEIASIHYSPRLGGIGIYEGYEYELFCWRDNGWKSVGKKTASGETIEFSVPRNALLYLRNNVLKKNGEVFFIIDDKICYYK